MNFINTTPHDIKIKCKDGSIITIVKGPSEIQAHFRGTTKVISLGYITDSNGNEIAVTGDPTYKIESFDPIQMFGVDLKIGLIVSSITAHALKGHNIGKNVTILVPYSGPDQNKCKRNDAGEIQWISELMIYG